MFCEFLLLFFVSWYSVDAHYPVAKLNRTDISDNILCRECGTQLLISDTLISKASATSLHSFNDTIYNRQEVLVQLLVLNVFMRYPIITSSEASCLAKGDWEDDELWFPDHVMKPCYCPECGALVGWIFENKSPTIESVHQFYALILTNLIGENFLNSLTKYPLYY